MQTTKLCFLVYIKTKDHPLRILHHLISHSILLIHIALHLNLKHVTYYIQVTFKLIRLITKIPSLYYHYTKVVCRLFELSILTYDICVRRADLLQ